MELLDETSNNNVTIRAQYGGLRTGVQISILVLLSFFGGYVVLYSDRHNDGRYVSKEEYTKDRETDKEVRDLMQGNLTSRLEAQEKKLDEISHDVKSLLQRPAANSH